MPVVPPAILNVITGFVIYHIIPSFLVLVEQAWIAGLLWSMSTISQLLDLMDGGVSDRCKVLTAETLTIGSCLETLEVDIGAQTNNKLMLGL
jgi:hypothetical protein